MILTWKFFGIVVNKIIFQGEVLSGDEFDREEELRGYNRAIDFTLHTILEESCEDSEAETRPGGGRDGAGGGARGQNGGRKRLSDPTALEKYFFYEVGGGMAPDSGKQVCH